MWDWAPWTYYQRMATYPVQLGIIAMHYFVSAAHRDTSALMVSRKTFRERLPKHDEVNPSSGARFGSPKWFSDSCAHILTQVATSGSDFNIPCRPNLACAMAGGNSTVFSDSSHFRTQCRLRRITRSTNHLANAVHNRKADRRAHREPSRSLEVLVAISAVHRTAAAFHSSQRLDLIGR
jgi:hypothetical protein